MKFGKRILAGLLCLVMIVFNILNLVACGNSDNASDNESDTQNTTESHESEHTFTVEAVKKESLKSEANCTDAAIYFKSCACGATPLPTVRLSVTPIAITTLFATFAKRI